MPDNDKLDEILGQLRVLDTKIGFLEQDLVKLEQMIATLGETTATCFASLLRGQDQVRHVSRPPEKDKFNRGY